MEDIFQRFKFKFLYKNEIDQIKKIQNDNLDSYLLSICNINKLEHDYNTCKFEESNAHCTNLKSEFLLCKSLINEYKKVFKERQIEFFEKAFNEYKEKVK